MTCIDRRATAGILAAALLALAGCGGPGLATVDPERAGDALTAALAAWSRGEAPDSLARQSPAVYVGEPDWAGGRITLARFEVAGEPVTVGAGLQYRVTLTTRDARGRERRQAVCYRVYTAPQLSVVRECE